MDVCSNLHAIPTLYHSQVLHEIQLPSTPCRMALHSGSCLLAVASGETHGITVYDIEANGRLVRRFNGHE